MDKISEITKTVQVPYGSKDALLEFLRLRKIYGQENHVNGLVFQRPKIQTVEVTLTPYDKPDIDSDTPRKRRSAVAALNKRKLLPCTFWEAATLYPEVCPATQEERTAFIQVVSTTHSILLLGVEELGSRFGTNPAYIYRSRFGDMCYSFLPVCPTFPVYLAGYRVVR